MNNDAWFKCFPRRLLSDTMHLGNHDFGAYWRALCFYFLSGPLENDDQSLRKIFQVEPQDWERTRIKVLVKFFILESDGLWHNRFADELIIDREKRHNQTMAGRQSLLVPQPDNGTDSVTEPVTEVVTTGEVRSTEVQKYRRSEADGRNGLRTTSVCDDDWIAVLSKSSAYTGIDVRRELGKMTAWCEVNQRKPTRRRFVNWLNRCEKPMQPRKPYVPNL